MKKILLVLIIAGSTIVNGFAQCTPDPSFTLPGIYPDTATGLADAYTGSPYSETITAVVPTDTMVEIEIFGIPTMVNVDIDDITLDTVIGLPPNFDYACNNPTNCVFAGGTSGCVGVFSTVDPTPSDIGVYPLIITTITHGTAVGTAQTQEDTITAYFIEIKDGSTVSVDQYSNTSLKLSDIAPNPVTGLSKLQILSGVSSTGKLVITNLLGSVIKSEEIRLNKGVTNFTINASEFNSGIYLLTVASENKRLTKRIAIKN